RPRSGRALRKLLQRGHLPLAAGDVRGLAAEPLPELRRPGEAVAERADLRLPLPARARQVLRRPALTALPRRRAPRGGAGPRGRRAFLRERRLGSERGARRARLRALLRVRGWALD